MDTERMTSTAEKVEAVRQAAHEGRLEDASEGIVEWITENIIMYEGKERKGKKWFDKDCYNMRTRTLKALHRARELRSQAALLEYNTIRREYKEVLKQKKKAYLEEQHRKLIEDIEKDPYRALRIRQPIFPADIPIHTWEAHMRKILCHRETRPQKSYDKEVEECELFTRQELRRANLKRKNNRAPGPDGIRNEHLKQCIEFLLPVWVELINKCLITGSIPAGWRRSTIKLLYKGKGNVSDLNAYRGVALEAVGFKLLTSVLTVRLSTLLEPYFPEEQFGFRPKRSTLMAAGNLIADIHQTLEGTQRKLYVVLVDYSKAFDLVNREILIKKLESLVGRNWMTRLVSNILAENYVQVDDSVGKSEWISQTNGVLQGDPLSPLLFNVLTHDVGRRIKENTHTRLYMYADDMAFGSENIADMQRAVDLLSQWAEENEVKINEEKTELVVFRRGGRLAEQDKVSCKGKLLNVRGSCRYLGLTIQTTGKSFSVHLKERLIAATRAIHEISNPTLMSLNSAMQLFEVKVSPTFSYGLELVWEYLTTNQLRSMEGLKARFLKKVMGLSKYAPSRLTYVLARETYLVEDLRLKFLLPSTESYKKLLEELQRKRAEIWEDFYTTEAMLQHEWKETDYQMRRIVTGLAVHGFHFKMCKTKSFHDPRDKCVCELCGQPCERYHIKSCAARKCTISELIRGT